MKPRDLELPLSPSLLGGPGSQWTLGSGTGSGLQAPGPGLMLSLLPTHTLTPVLLTPRSLPPSIHFWSILSPIAPRSPATLSFQFLSSGSTQVHIPSISVDGLSTPVVLSPGPQKPWLSPPPPQPPPPLSGVTPSMPWTSLQPAVSRRNIVQLTDSCFSRGWVGILRKKDL